MSRSTNRSAFGLVELLVVIAVMALLVGLLAPAIQRVRMAAERMQSMNNLKQCALAIHNYHDTFNKLPDAFAKDPAQNGQRTLWFQILPFVEQANVFQNDAAETSVVPTYIAQDDPSKTDPKGKLNYSANLRVFGYQTYGPQACDDVGKPMKVKDPKTEIICGARLQNIPDGTSNTIMMSTRMASCNRTAKGDPIHTTINGDPGTPHGPFFGATEISKAPSPLYDATPKMMYQISPTDFDNLPVGQSKKCIDNPSGVPHALSGDRLLVSMFDGSCRTVRTSVTPFTFACALSPADGNPLGQDWEE